MILLGLNDSLRIIQLIDDFQDNKIVILSMRRPRFSATLSTIFIIIAFHLISAVTSERLLQESQNQIGSSSSTNTLPQMKEVSPINMTFTQFKTIYGKRYSSVAEENYRLHVFRYNIKKMNQHNRNKSRTYNMKPNNFLDVTSSEFKQLYTGTYKSDSHSRNVSNQCLRKKEKAEGRQRPHNKTWTKRSQSNNSQIQNSSSKWKSQRNKSETVNYTNDQDNITNSTNITDNQDDINNTTRLLVTAQSISNAPKPKNVLIDWTLYAGSVKYQGFCGACYAFTAVDTFSAMSAINKYGFFIPLSVQQVIECSNNNLTFGCSGGYLEGAFTYIQLNGVSTQQAYPYTSVNTGKVGKCQQTGGPFKLSSFNSIVEGDCNAVLNSLALGPVSVGIAGYNLQFYDTGIFNDCNQVLDHAVVIVGYKSGMGWRIKNSWGTQWGENGFGWIAEGNTCGICNMAVSIVV